MGEQHSCCHLSLTRCVSKISWCTYLGLMCELVEHYQEPLLAAICASLPDDEH